MPCMEWVPALGIQAGFYLGIFVWGGSSGEGTAQDARLAGGLGVLPQII